MEQVINYDDGSKQEIAMTETEVEVSGYDKAQKGEQTILICIIGIIFYKKYKNLQEIK